MRDVPRPRRLAAHGDVGPLREDRADFLEKLAKRRPFSAGDVEDVPRGLRTLRRRGQQVGQDDVADGAEVARRGPVAEDHRVLSAPHGVDPSRDHGGVGAVGVLPGPEDVEVAEPDGLEAVGPRPELRIELVDRLRQGFPPNSCTSGVNSPETSNTLMKFPIDA